MSYNYRQPNTRPKPIKSIVVIFCIITISIVGYWLWQTRHNDTTTTTSAPQPDESTQVAQTPEYEAIDLQPTIDTWISQQSASYSIAIYDLQNNQLIASNDPDEAIFAASLYKIFVAYLSYIDFQDGAQDPSDILVNGYTKLECVDKMIRESDSPCGEAMMAEIGQVVLNQKVLDLGMTNTRFDGIQTSARDAALILKLINDKRHLEVKNTTLLLDSMLTQDTKYKRGLQAGAPRAVWQTKVGWNENVNYHDIGIMTLPDGRKFVVAILGQGSGSPVPIANFATTIYSALQPSTNIQPID